MKHDTRNIRPSPGYHRKYCDATFGKADEEIDRIIAEIPDEPTRKHWIHAMARVRAVRRADPRKDTGALAVLDRQSGWREAARHCYAESDGLQWVGRCEAFPDLPPAFGETEIGALSRIIEAVWQLEFSIEIAI